MLESDSSLALFIVDIRSKQGTELEEYLLKHRLEIAAHEKNVGGYAFDLIYRHLFLASYNFPFDHIHFSRAIASTERRIKRLGYLGSTFSRDADFHKCIFNYIKSDISDPNSQRYVINYLATGNTNLELCKILMPKMKYLMDGHTFRMPATVIFYKSAYSIENLSLFEKNEMQFFVKLQIAIDRLNGDPSANDIKFMDKKNEIDLVCAMLRKSSKYYLKMKCLQFLAILRKFKHTFEQHLLKYIDDSINTVRLLKKPACEVGYYIECVKFLLEGEFSSNKTHTFVFKMLESKHEIYIKIGARISMKYGIYKDVAMEKCIFVGLNDKDILHSFLKMIDKQNCKAIYKRKQEIILTLEGRDCSDQEIDNITEKFLRRIFDFTDSKESMKIYLEEPTFCIKLPISNHIIEEDRKKLLLEIKNKKDWMYFVLIYQAIGNNLSSEKHSKMVDEHLMVLYEHSLIYCNSNIIYTVSYLLSLLPYLGNCQLVQQKLIKMYTENTRRNSNHKLGIVLLSKILFFNIFLDEKVIYMGKDVFLWYKIVRDGKNKNIVLKCMDDVSEIKLKNSKGEIKSEEIAIVGNFTERTFNEISNYITIVCSTIDMKYENKIMISEN